MLDDVIRKKLLIHAEQLALQLSSYSSPQNREPLQPEHISAITNYLTTFRTIAGLKDLLEILPDSYLARASAITRSQIEDVTKHILILMERGITHFDYLMFILRWSERFLWMDRVASPGRGGGKQKKQSYGRGYGKRGGR